MPAPTIDLEREIADLAAFEGRAAGTDAERRAAVHLRKRLEALGREAEIEPISVFPAWGVAHALHAVVAIVGGVLSVDRPLLGAVLVALAALSAIADLTGVAHLGRRLTGRRASQNVVSREDEGKPGVLLLVAHYDAARTGALFGARAARRRARIGRLLRRPPIGALAPFGWAMLVVLACAIARVAGVDALALTIVQFVATVVLIAYVPLLVDVPLSGPVPAANDNASGVATVLRLAERHGGALEHFDVWVLLTGAEEGIELGMRAWLRRHRGELDPTATVVVCVQAVGDGMPRYAVREGPLVGSRYHPTLVQLCDELAEDHGAARFSSRTWSDAHAARLRGLPAIRVSCLDELGVVPREHLPSDVPERVDPAAVERALAFCSELAELVDQHVGPDLEDEAGAGEGLRAEGEGPG